MTWRARLLALAFGTGAGGCGGGDPSSAAGPPGVELTDAQVAAMVTAASGWTYYRNRPDTLLRSVASGHSAARLRTRYNARAATQLDANGRVRAGVTFPDSSLIVKELIAGSALERYAIMMKLSSSANAGAGWLWAYYAPDGSTQISVTARGSACVACHSTGVDFTRMNDAHP